MKKLILLLGMILLSNGAMAANCDYSCVEPYDMNNKFRAVLSNVTGLNFLTENRVESIMKKEVFKIAQADELKINVKSHSSKDIKNGIFKSMSVSGKNVVVNDIHFSSLKLATLCDFNYIKQSGKEIVFVEDMPISFDVVVTPDDINNTMKHSRYAKIIDDLNRLTQTYGGGLQISSTKVSIQNKKFYYVIGFSIPFITKEPKVVISADLRVKDGKIDYKNTKLASGHIKLDLQKLDFAINYLNPLNFSVNIISNKNSKVIVKNVEIKDDAIYSDGIIIVPKD